MTLVTSVLDLSEHFEGFFDPKKCAYSLRDKFAGGFLADLNEALDRHHFKDSAPDEWALNSQKSVDRNKAIAEHIRSRALQALIQNQEIDLYDLKNWLEELVSKTPNLMTVTRWDDAPAHIQELTAPVLSAAGIAEDVYVGNPRSGDLEATWDVMWVVTMSSKVFARLFLAQEKKQAPLTDELNKRYQTIIDSFAGAEDTYPLYPHLVNLVCDIEKFQRRTRSPSDNVFHALINHDLSLARHFVAAGTNMAFGQALEQPIEKAGVRHHFVMSYLDYN